MRRAVEIGAGIVLSGVIGLGIGNAVIEGVHNNDPTPAEQQTVIAAGEVGYNYDLRDNVIRGVFGIGGMALAGVCFGFYEEEQRRQRRESLDMQLDIILRNAKKD